MRIQSITSVKISMFITKTSNMKCNIYSIVTHIIIAGEFDLTSLTFSLSLNEEAPNHFLNKNHNITYVTLLYV
jgi:hypothetical protein